MKQIEFFVDKKKLKGTVIFPKKLKEKNPAILFIHGWTSERERSYQYANGLAKLGYISFLFDMSGHGESEGNINTTTTKEFFDDVLGAYDYFVDIKGVDRKNINVIGSSFGSYLGTLLTTERNVKSLVLRVPADYPNNFFNKSKMETSGILYPSIIAWRKLIKNSIDTFALRAISNFNGDVLIIESERDEVVFHETIQNYINAIKDKNKLTHVVIKNAPHSIKAGPFKDEVEKILADWFKNITNK